MIEILSLISLPSQIVFPYILVSNPVLFPISLHYLIGICSLYLSYLQVNYSELCNLSHYFLKSIKLFSYFVGNCSLSLGIVYLFTNSSIPNHYVHQISISTKLNDFFPIYSSPNCILSQIV